MGLSTFQATVAYPEAPPAWEAEAKAINEEGGVDGHEIEIIICNDQGNPQVASQCAREAVEKEVAAVMGSYTVQAAAFLPVLEQAKIPYVGADASQDIEATSPMSFPVESQYQVYGAMGYAAGTKDCKKAALITEDYGAATDSEDETAEKAYEGSLSEGEFVKRVMVGSNTTDYAPAVATALSAGAECIMATLPPEENPKLFAAVAQSSAPETTIAMTGPSTSEEFLEAVGEEANGTLVGSTGYVPGSVPPSKNVEAAIKQIKAFDPSAEINIFSISATATVKILAHVAEEAGGEIDHESMLAGLEELEGYETELVGPFTTTKPGPLPGKPRLFNMQILPYEVVSEKLKQTNDEFVDLGPIIGG